MQGKGRDRMTIADQMAPRVVCSCVLLLWSARDNHKNAKRAVCVRNKMAVECQRLAREEDVSLRLFGYSKTSGS